MTAWLLLGLLGTTAAARDNDVQIWSDAGLAVRVHDRWTVDIGAAIRSKTTEVDEVFVDTGAEFKALKWLRLGLGYRLGFDKFDPTRVRHRIALDVTFAPELDPVKLRFRLRQTFRPPTPSDEWKYNIRPRAKVGVDTGSIVEPYLALEPFIKFAPQVQPTLDKWRFTVGLDVAAGPVDLSVYYSLEEPSSDPKDARLHIVGFSIGAELDARAD